MVYACMMHATFWFLSFLLSLAVAKAPATLNIAEAILRNAEADSIDLTLLEGFSDIIAAIVAVYEENGATPRSLQNLPENIIDVHSHVLPAWYRKLVPLTGQNPTPEWDFNTYLDFNMQHGITKSVMSFSTPGANVFKGNRTSTIALARLMNEQLVAFARAHPEHLSFYAVVPLPYTADAIVEMNYAINKLGAVGVGMYSNYEGLYPGNPAFTPFFEALNSLDGSQVVHVHPGPPYIKLDGMFIEANPTIYPTATVEFYFETARAFEDLTMSQTIVNFTNINYILPHVGGAFPSIIDRMLRPLIVDQTPFFDIYHTRFWWDSAGPTFFHQVAGLFGYDISATRLLFGSDFPYVPVASVDSSLTAIENTTFLTAENKLLLFSTNAQILFGNRL